MLILAVAANTSFAGFPRLAAILARDGFLPRQLSSLGDRLVFANGIVLLAIATGVLIILFGWLLASFPWWPLTRITEVRIPGVLPRIGLAYLGGYLVTRRGSLRAQVLTLVALLYGYWWAMTLLPVPVQGGIGANLLDDPSRSLAAWLDRLLLDGHLWRQRRTWDPEGILSTFPAVVTCLLGAFAGDWMRASRTGSRPRPSGAI